MIFNFSVVNSDEEYRDVEFYCALTDYKGPAWKRFVTFEKSEDAVRAEFWEFDPSDTTFEQFIGTPPAWVVNLFNTLTPQIEHLARTGEKLVAQCLEELEPETA